MNKEELALRKKSPIQIRNKKASFEYFFIDTYTAGIVLTGTEIKSIRLGKASLVDAFCYIHRGEIWIKGMNISPYFYGSYSNPEAKRDRKLLLTKREIRKLEADLRRKKKTGEKWTGPSKTFRCSDERCNVVSLLFTLQMTGQGGD